MLPTFFYWYWYGLAEERTLGPEELSFESLLPSWLTLSKLFKLSEPNISVKEKY